MDKKNVQKRFAEKVLTEKKMDTIKKNYRVILNDIFFFVTVIFSKKNLKRKYFLSIWKHLETI
jgi:hypothetical protein